MDTRINTNTLRYDNSGFHGKRGTNGSSGCSSGTSGNDGTTGENGGHASGLSVRLATGNGQVFVDKNGQRAQFPLSKRDACIFLKARGGNGGDGGHGGRGAKGRTGDRGSDATRYSNGTDGGRGGPGGRGGNGGCGGNAGNGAKVSIQVNPEDTDLLMLTNIPDVSGGTKGKGGFGGNGGKGGDGGRGGNSLRWTTTGYKTKTDEYGTHTETYTIHHYNPGGHTGPRGREGCSGNNGADGRDGNDGTFTIIAGSKQYKTPYNLSVTGCDLKDDSDDQIIEPGERVEARFKVKNNGGMPTPDCQSIRMELVNDRWVNFDPQSTFHLPTALQAGQQYTPKNVLKFRVSEAAMVTGAPLKAEARVHFRATVERVEREFSQVKSQYKDFVVKYPAQLDPISGVSCISADEEALISVKVNNISSRELGVNGEQRRTVNMKYEVLPNSETSGSDITFFSRDGDVYNGHRGLDKSVRSLPSHKKETMSGSLVFSNPGLEPYSRVRVAAKLQLGNLAFPDDEQQAKTIQQTVFEVQLAETFRANPAADFLLVTNGNTSLNEMRAWQKLARQLGLKFATWNSTLYNGISLYHQSQPQPEVQTAASAPAREMTAPAFKDYQSESLTIKSRSLLELFQDKTIVFLNYPDSRNKIATDTLPSFELFYSASLPNNIRTYVVGNAVTHEDQFHPDEDYVENIKPITKVESYLFRKDISKGKLKKSAEKHAEQLRRKHPEKTYTVVYDYRIRKLPNSRFGIKRYELGDIRSCLSPRQNMFTYLNNPSNAANRSAYVNSEPNVYRLLKSLSLTKKLTLIKSVDESHKDCLKKAIFADLVDEYKAFSQDKWTGTWNKESLKNGLSGLQQVLNGEYNDEEKQWIQELLLEFRAFTCRIPNLADRWFIRRRQRLLSCATQEMVDGFLQKKHLVASGSWKEKYEAINMNLKKIGRAQVWSKYQSPADSVLPQYDLADKNRVIDKQNLDAAYSCRRTSSVAESQHHFENQEQRLLALKKLERKDDRQSSA